MTKVNYFVTGCTSILASILLIILMQIWPLKDYSLYDIFAGNIALTDSQKSNLISSLQLNYALDSLLILFWIGSSIGLLMHFETLKINIKAIRISITISLLGALLDFTENAISMNLAYHFDNLKNTSNYILIHSITREISFWLPMISAFILALSLPKLNKFPTLFLFISGTLGIVFACLGMYLPTFSMFPIYWFGIWFFASGIFLLNEIKKLK